MNNFESGNLTMRESDPLEQNRVIYEQELKPTENQLGEFEVAKEGFIEETMQEIGKIEQVLDTVIKMNESLQGYANEIQGKDKEVLQDKIRKLQERAFQIANRCKGAMITCAKVILVGGIIAMGPSQDIKAVETVNSSTVSYELADREQANFEKIVERAEKELMENGITNDQRRVHTWVNDSIYKRIRPWAYGTDNKKLDLKAIFEGVGYEDEEEFGQSERAQSRENAWRLYLGIPQEHDTFGISKYYPKNSKDFKYYYRINGFFDKFSKDQFFRGNKKEMIRSIVRTLDGEMDMRFIGSEIVRDNDGKPKAIIEEDKASTVMGFFNLTKGKDAEGSYIAYYDKWDLDIPMERDGEGLFGKPLEIYDRIYYNPETFEPIFEDMENSSHIAEN